MATSRTTRRYVTFGNLLSMHLADAKMLQNQLAERSGVDAAIINKMVRGWSFGKSVKTISKYLQPILTTLIAERGIISIDQVKEFLETSPLNNSSEGRAKIPELLEIAEKALEKQQALDRPRYYTSHTEFIGREEDINKIIAILLNPHSRIRIVTLVGIPGVGKTELARQIAKLPHVQAHFSSPSILILPLEGVTRIADVIQSIRVHLSERHERTLIILDNCEEIEDTPETISKLSKFLEAQRQLTILATSRRPFHLGYTIEYIHNVTTLKVPNYEDVNTLPFEKLQANDDAVELFRQAAVGNDKKFTLTEQNIKTVAAICRAFDGLPLALLIAGALIKYEPIDHIQDWIRENGLIDAEYRTDVKWQQSLNLLIEKSYKLLTKEGQMLLRRLTLFVGTCHIEAVKAVCITDNDLLRQEIELSNLLITLHHSHLITYSDGMIDIFHITIYDFVLQKLLKDENENDIVQVKKQFIDYYYQLVTEYMRAKHERGQAEVADYHRLLQGEESNIISLLGYITIINAYFTEEKLKSEVGKENYDIWKEIVEECARKGYQERDTLGLSDEFPSSNSPVLLNFLTEILKEVLQKILTRYSETPEEEEKLSKFFYVHRTYQRLLFDEDNTPYQLYTIAEYVGFELGNQMLKRFVYEFKIIKEIKDTL